MKLLLLSVLLYPLSLSSSFDAYYHNQDHPDILNYRTPTTVTPSQMRRESLIVPQFSLKRSPEIDDLHAAATPPRLSRSIEISPMSPEEIHVVEVQAHAQETKALSKKKIACLVAATAITSSVLTAAVTLTIHFTECKK